MRVLIVEDRPDKAATLSGVVTDVCKDARVSVVGNIRDVVAALERRRYDLIVLDLMLPLVEGSIANVVGLEILRVVERSKRNRSANLVAITAYGGLIEKLERRYVDAGVFLVHYTDEGNEWRTTVRSIIARTNAEVRCDFVIFCAKEVERGGYVDSNIELGSSYVENGLDVQSAMVSDYLGRVILLPRPGLVDAACVASIAVERYRPQVVAMSGMCAGVKGRVKLGQVVVCEGCWDYQVGKYTEREFEFEPYQEMVDDALRVRLKALCRSKKIADVMGVGFEELKLEDRTPRLGLIVSGSSVVASESRRREICEQHRKICGLEMEMSALFRAVNLVEPSVCTFAAKGVADFGDVDKDDRYQKCASVLSARFVVEGIEVALREHW